MGDGKLTVVCSLLVLPHVNGDRFTCACMLAALLDFPGFDSWNDSPPVLLMSTLTFSRQFKCGPLLMSKLKTDISPRVVLVASQTSLIVFF